MSAAFGDPTLYFGYGSNLWKHQMSLRCPGSQYLGLARLQHYHWIINSRGYANIVETKPAPSSTAGADVKNVVWGLVYSLTSEDEAKLDRNEGVPDAYTKEKLTLEFWPKDGAQSMDVIKTPQSKTMLVYINRQLTSGDNKPKAEYIHRMNNGVVDALAEGVPPAYISKVIRHWIPEESREDEREASNGGEAQKTRTKDLAEQQARSFVEEDARGL
ncbi:MAG: hypothetical protein M1820_002839 [Bogoriella megaspora]|nr:MAG: hypothetical protein M1820_002839 [Bogoriella megaspora]